MFNKNNAIYKATLNVSNSKNGDKILYDIDVVSINKNARMPVISGALYPRNNTRSPVESGVLYPRNDKIPQAKPNVKSKNVE